LSLEGSGMSFLHFPLYPPAHLAFSSFDNSSLIRPHYELP
jgi:hypothetical protein